MVLIRRGASSSSASGLPLKFGMADAEGWAAPMPQPLAACYRVRITAQLRCTFSVGFARRCPLASRAYKGTTYEVHLCRALGRKIRRFGRCKRKTVCAPSAPCAWVYLQRLRSSSRGNGRCSASCRRTQACTSQSHTYRGSVPVQIRPPSLPSGTTSPEAFSVPASVAVLGLMTAPSSSYT